MPVRALLLFTIVSCAAALEGPPRSILAVEGPEPELRHQQRVNGCAVLLTADGLAVTLAEAVPADDAVTVLLPGGARRSAAVVARGATSGAVLLRLPLEDSDPLAPAAIARSQPLRIGDVVWTAGNSYGALEDDGAAVLSRGVVSGRYRIPEGHPPIRGRLGAVLTDYRGPVIETDAAVNDGDQGGALLDDAGRLLGLVSLGVIRQRKLGTAIPIDLILDDLAAALPELERHQPVGSDALAARFAAAAAELAPGLALVYLERPAGPGNPDGMPRPSPISPALPRYEQERLAEQWGRYYHQQQVFFTDQAITAVCLDPAEGLLLTAASNLHGQAEGGFVLLPSGTVRCAVHAVHRQLDLAILRCDAPLDLPAIEFAAEPGLHTGDPVALIGRHRDGGPFTMTTGVVSAVGRRFAQSPFPLGQTDALANYGSLGGVVLDLDGRAVGLVTMLGPNPNWRWFINSGVAMFADGALLAQVLPALRAGESVVASDTFSFGLGIRSRWDDDAEQAIVTEILPGTGAAESDLRPEDRIERVDGVRIHHPRDISRLILRHQAGDSCELGVRRGEQLVVVPVELRVLDGRTGEP